MKTEVDDRVRPFSQGTQAADWVWGNCDRCVRKAPGCDLYGAICAAYCGDGTISRAHAERLGVPAVKWSDWRCAEFEASPATGGG